MGKIVHCPTWWSLLAALFVASPLVGQSTQERTGPPAHALALRDIGISGLRGLLSASGGLGDLENRAGSYRMAGSLEQARARTLEGRIAALEMALADSDLPESERNRISGLRDAALAELEAVPRYEAGYTTGTLQLESMVPFGLLGERPLFLLVRGRGHVRGGGEDRLTVYSERASIAPVLVASDRVIVALGLELGRADVRIGHFAGSSGTTSFGPQLNVGAVLGDRWSIAFLAAHAWADGSSTIVRTGPGQEQQEIRTEGRSQTTALKAELRGGLSATGPWGLPVAAHPRIGGFFKTTYAPATTNSLGETGTGPFGTRESVAALRAGVSMDIGVGGWSPGLYLGWERELAHGMSALIDDPNAMLAAVGSSWSWSRGGRLSLDYTMVRGFEGRRSVSEVTFVLILDG